MKKFLFSPFLSFASQILPIAIIFAAAVLIRYPIIFNSDHFFTSDEGVMANTIMNMLEGGSIVFYYDYARYFGLTGGILAVPFMWIFGFNTMAFNLPATLFFSLYLWTLYLIAREIIPGMAFLVLILILISPPYVTQMTTHNWPHIASAFFGNIIFLFFIKVKLSEKKRGGIIFFLFFTMGLAIYTYTFSLIYISVVAFLHALSCPQWNQLRQRFSLASLAGWFKGQKSKRKVFVQILDVVIVLFLLVIVFSYVFGGFGLDIAGVSIFQVNNFHKPVFQMLAILVLRILIYRKDLLSYLKSVKDFISKEMPRETRVFVWLGGAGFLLGLSPRIASILKGETSRGGQGFDVDFSPIKLIGHLWDIIVVTLPRLFSLEISFRDFNFTSIGSYGTVLGILAIPLLLLLFFSAASFCSSRWNSLKSILTLQGVKFDPGNIYLLLPLLTCLANVFVQNGSQPRYLFPMFGTLVLFIGIFVNRFQKKFKGLPILVLVIWIGFYSMATYKSYEDQGLVKGFEVIKLGKIEIYDLVEFLESKDIEVAYSNYAVSQVGTFLSKGKINISEYSNNPAAKTQKRRSLKSSYFAVVAQKKQIAIYNEFLLDKKIEFKAEELGGYKIYWEFSGDQGQINKLRSLVPGNV
ncbi:MAG: hypothetical protein HOD90_06380 [Nitrospina sp.]|nr:hypothetical protein [Nitrospina sp.]